MRSVVASPLFGVLISLLTFELGYILYKKYKLAVLNPLLISILLTIAFLAKFNIPFEDFNKGGQFISFFLGPATVILALPLYKKLSLLKANAMPILIGIAIGSIFAIISVLLLSRIFGLPDELTASLLPKSITTPIGIEVSEQLGGDPSLTIVAIIITGTTGAVTGAFFLRLFKITDKIATGIAIGTSSHALGTTKALELGEVEGAMSGLTIGIAGIFTVLIAPLFWYLYKIIF
jgi:predicted murein hydrolase (TIGR00659 family)